MTHTSTGSRRSVAIQRMIAWFDRRGLDRSWFDRRVSAGLAAVCATILIAVPATAQAQAGHFEIRSAYAELEDGIYYLNTRVDFQLSDSVEEALQSGVALTFELQINVSRTRKYLPDPEIAGIKQRYRLEHHALSERYLLTDLNSGNRDSYSTLNAALNVLGRVNQLPILDESLLEPDLRYEISVRAIIDTGGLPGPVRLLAFWREDWRLASEWYRWPLRP